MAAEKQADARGVQIAIIGGGLGGIAAAVNLKRRGIHSFTLFEKSPRAGGTWWDNQYPGAQCDVPSALYSFSFKLHDWSRTHANQAEIHDYLEETIDEFGFRSNLRLGTGVARADWSDEREQYLVELDSGETHWFDVVISAVGMLNVPNIPAWPGMDEYTGPMFHSARWDSSVDLTGKRVAVVGAGASAAQVVPGLQPTVGELLSFQREPSWVMPKGDRDYSDEERAELNRFGRRRRARWSTLRAFDSRSSGDTASAEASKERLTALVEQQFADRPELRDFLIPKYLPRCKRNVFSDLFYPALKEPNVRLIPRSVERMTARGVVDDQGEEHEVDAVVLTTGFQAVNFLSTLEVTGRGGANLHEEWGDDPAAFMGITVPKFPNFYLLYGPNTHGTVVSFVLERQAEYAARDIRRLVRAGGGTIEVKAEANEWYQKTLQDAIDEVDVWKSGCNNFYVSPSGRNVVQWPWSHKKYWWWARKLRRSSSTMRPLSKSARTARAKSEAENVLTRS